MNPKNQVAKTVCSMCGCWEEESDLWDLEFPGWSGGVQPEDRQLWPHSSQGKAACLHPTLGLPWLGWGARGAVGAVGFRPCMFLREKPVCGRRVCCP